MNNEKAIILRSIISDLENSIETLYEIPNMERLIKRRKEQIAFLAELEAEKPEQDEARELIKEIREDLLNCFDLMNHAVNEDYWEPEQQVLWIKLQNDIPELLKEIERV